MLNKIAMPPTIFVTFTPPFSIYFLRSPSQEEKQKKRKSTAEMLTPTRKSPNNFIMNYMFKP